MKAPMLLALAALSILHASAPRVLEEHRKFCKNF
jgi:hypothetical protein